MLPFERIPISGRYFFRCGRSGYDTRITVLAEQPELPIRQV